jgi:hypothetical protein
MVEDEIFFAFGEKTAIPERLRGDMKYVLLRAVRKRRLRRGITAQSRCNRRKHDTA